MCASRVAIRGPEAAGLCDTINNKSNIHRTTYAEAFSPGQYMNRTINRTIVRPVKYTCRPIFLGGPAHVQAWFHRPRCWYHGPSPSPVILKLMSLAGPSNLKNMITRAAGHPEPMDGPFSMHGPAHQRRFTTSPDSTDFCYRRYFDTANNYLA